MFSVVLLDREKVNFILLQIAFQSTSIHKFSELLGAILWIIGKTAPLSSGLHCCDITRKLLDHFLLYEENYYDVNAP